MRISAAHRSEFRNRKYETKADENITVLAYAAFLRD